MICPDVNVLVYAHRVEMPEHPAYARWLIGLASGAAPFGLSELVLSGFVRVVTNRRAFLTPTPLRDALAFVESLRSRRAARLFRAGPRHWDIFVSQCANVGATGSLVADAYHAALAIEHGLTWATADADFSRFPGLATLHPLRP